MSNICLPAERDVSFAAPAPQGVRGASGRKPRLLFVAEAITLAQVVRLAALAEGVDRSRYDVGFACGAFDAIAFAGSRLTPLPLFTIDRARALEKIERGERLYEESVLTRYVEEELMLFERWRPDLVIGDFRLSLAVSAARVGVPHATLINAYFSPHAVRESFPVPDHPLVSLVGARRAAEYFPRVLPRVFAHFVAPLDALRARYGLGPSGGLLNALCAGDFTLYPDVPELCPTRALPRNHRYLGPIGWSAPVALPAFWSELDPARPLVYVALGSSGRLSALKSVLGVLAELDVNVVLSTAGRFELESKPANVWCVRYLPGELVAREASFVITNGGASTSYQALGVGTPVLGIPSNLDQYLAMTAIERAGAGRLVRSGEATPARVRAAVHELLTSSSLRAGARALAAAFARSDAHAGFRSLLEQVFPVHEERR